MAMRVKKHSQKLHGKLRVYIAVTAYLPYRLEKQGVTLVPH
jgi:hypothetical protein